MEKDKITETKVKRSGVFDFKELYQFVYRWLVEEGYDTDEKKYVEEATGDTKKVEIKWESYKKITDYFKIEMKFEWRIVGLKSVEVEQNGKKVKMNDGTFEVKISGTLIRDYQGTWDKTPMMKFIRGVYDKYIVRATVEKYEGKVFGDVEDIAEQIKAFLTIEGMK